jgi:hypothetical protein
VRIEQIDRDGEGGIDRSPFTTEPPQAPPALPLTELAPAIIHSPLQSEDPELNSPQVELRTSGIGGESDKGRGYQELPSLTRCGSGRL